ncbi:ATP-dependent DNA ligase [Sanguibacter sp. 25GB23B1]|uniref:ATP-dependent DNA ligase n=1 Tax=unclassified Sanguibacter TaxID=2645534 RepID=UPI0032AF6892
MPARGATRDVVVVDGHRITLTNLGKVLYPATGTTKADVLAYLAAVSGPLVTHAAHRPATRKRWVHGTGGDVFFQKNLDDSTPSWVHRREIAHSDHVNTYPLVDDLATLTWLGQIAALEIHVPQWRFGRTGKEHLPDRLVLDLDPGPGTGLAECAEVARWAREILVDMGLEPFPVTSGSKGIHLYAALDGTNDSAAVSAVAHELARALEADHPDLVVSDMKKSLRDGKVLVDWSQNSRNKTTIAPYSLRGRDRPTVAAPRTWEELDAPGLGQLELDEVAERVARDGDHLAGLAVGGRASLEPTAERMATFDRLSVYRSKRDASKTPEPVPEADGGATDSARVRETDDAAADGAPTYVIQEHHARRLHFDFRLEHDGVLVSWALPKGEPDDPKRNHLAVQTEDHPIEYGTFEGTIPKGEYGAGEVTIWDAGTYELHKWREGEEVIVTLHSAVRTGAAGETGPVSRKVALIHTGKGDDASTWLIHLMASDPAGSHASGTHPSDDHAEPGGTKPTSDRAHAEPAKSSAPTPPSRPTSPLTPMLATPGSTDDLDGDEDWAFEMKWDGIRTLATISAGEVRLVSRNGVDLTATYPELAELAACVEGDAVLDGEIVALTRAGRPDFGRLQIRMNLSKEREVAKARAKQPVDLMLFDVLERDGHRLTKQTYDERRRALAEIVTESGRIHVPPAFESEHGSGVRSAAAEAMEASEKLGLEGVVAKRRDSTYRPGRRASAWVKIKHVRTQEVVVVGWRPGRGTRASTVGSLLVAVPRTDGELGYAGRVGTGFSEKELARLTAELARAERATPPVDDVPRAEASDAHWVSPTRVGEVAFGEWTETGRLRHPVWRGWRPDMSPGDVRREQS